MFGIPQLLARFMALLSRLFGNQLGRWIGMALLFLGIEVAIVGATLLPFINDARAAFGGLGGQLADWGGVLNLDIYVSMILSAHGIVAAKDAGRMMMLQAGRR